jgi:multidrug efflux pump subunit AcrB
MWLLAGPGPWLAAGGEARRRGGAPAAGASLRPGGAFCSSSGASPAACWVIPIRRELGWVVFRGFNWLFERATQAYGTTVGWCLRGSAVVLLLYVGMIGLTGFGFSRIPTGFIPLQDKGYLVTNIVLPDSASLERTLAVTDAVERIAGFGRPTSRDVHVLNAKTNYSNVFVILSRSTNARPSLGAGRRRRIRMTVARCGGTISSSGRAVSSLGNPPALS